MSQPPHSAEATGAGPVGAADAETLAELRELQDRVNRTLREIASLSLTGEERLMAAGQELDAIVKATEVATENVLAAAESIQRSADGVLSADAGDAVGSHIDEIIDAVARIYEAATFQDITGQRISNVVATLTFVEQRIAGMMAIWGNEVAMGDFPEEDALAEDDERNLLNGPQLENQGISQSEIDSLFD